MLVLDYNKIRILGYRVCILSELLGNMEQIYGEIEGATDIMFSSPFSKIDDCEKGK